MDELTRYERDTQHWDDYRATERESITRDEWDEKDDLAEEA